MIDNQLRCRHRHLWSEHRSCFNEDGTLKEPKQVKQPKILLLDIETLPMSVFVWGLYKQRISPDNVISDFVVLSWSAKWLFDSRMFSDVLTSKEAINKDDKRIVEDMWHLLDDADWVIAHNAKGFDIGKLNARFLFYGFPPPSDYKVIDTLTVLRNKFKISSNSLDYATKFLGLEEKGHPGFETWKSCYKGDSKALNSMLEYNENDVTILEELYVRIRPWISNHPNWNLYIDTTEQVCPNCGSTKLTWNGTYKTQLGEYKAFRCECGAIGRSRVNEAKGKVLVKG